MHGTICQFQSLHGHVLEFILFERSVETLSLNSGVAKKTSSFVSKLEEFTTSVRQ